MAWRKTKETSIESVEVLMVEDNPGDVELTHRILADSEFDLNINVAEDGEVAMAYLRKEGEHADAPRPDLIILDVRMPGMTGYETCRKLKEDPATSEIPIVFLSAKGQEVEIEEGLASGALEYIVKPFAPDELVSQVKNILKRVGALE